ncbi:Amino-acid acetyltransferase, mitochondrial [Orbilia blumenaviensis]|uniref:Amino-acid acetyltransferase, mitochondrial n=1 Tax=Orbilia blumenaviensis TaxID=1796055 RepID=A0AAV9VJ25_9PEZI
MNGFVVPMRKLCRVVKVKGLLSRLRDGSLQQRRSMMRSSVYQQQQKKQHRQLGEEARDLYLSVLQASSTKREAKTYLQRFKPPDTALQRTTKSPDEPAFVVEQKEDGSFSTIVTNELVPGSLQKLQNREFIRGLLRKSRPQAFEQFSEDCFAPEVSNQHLHLALVKLRGPQHLTDVELTAIGRTLRKLGRLGLGSVVVVDVNEDGKPGAPVESKKELRKFHIEQMERVVSAIEDAGGQARSVEGSLTIDHNGDSHVLLPSLILAPVSRGAIPVIPALAHDHQQILKPTSPDSILVALCHLLADLQHHPETIRGLESPKGLMTLDRLIILDPLGGIPSYERPSGAHVFLNLEQEYSPVLSELRDNRTAVTSTHISTLRSLRQCLKLLPSTSSAVITTPEAAMTHEGPQESRNPLIHNLLTDKPVFSSSLPITPSTPRVITTLVKHGVPLLMLPPSEFENGQTLTSHPKLNLKRLVELIEDSFGKKLDVDHYLDRINKNVAGIIIAGDYDGGAIITWEESHNGRKVPYLDKFAVARKAQGTGGVADVVFKAMVHGNNMFQRELIWRSRQNNPVNKWYFERAKGTYKLPDGKWTIFWTTEGLSDGGCGRFQEYVGICERIVPSLLE